MTCWLCSLETTELVTNAQTPSCKNGSCQTCIALAKLNEEARDTFRRLAAKRYDLLSEHNRATDPMHRLPLELMNYIFQLVLPALDEYQWGAIFRYERSIVMPSDLTSVCKHWRDIALSNPFLWSTVRITLRNRATSDLSGWLNSVRDWILRSRTLPLTLRIAGGRAGEEEWRRLLDVIGPSSSRWDCLSLEIPEQISNLSHPNNLQYSRLRRLQLACPDGYVSNPLPLSNPTMSPEEIDINGLSFRALRISWNRLTSATVDGFHLQEITQLFQHASQMTHCHIMSLDGDESFSMPPIIHESLKAMSLIGIEDDVLATILLGSLTLPCLQEVYTDDMDYLTPAYLPALVRRSSCPLTTIKLSYLDFFPDFEPFPGVTNLYLQSVVNPDQAKKLLLEEEYFPHLRYITLQLQPFLFLWMNGIIRMLLDRKGPRPNGPNERRLPKILVVDKDYAAFDDMWKTDVGKELKELGIILRDDGFEFLCPENEVK